MNLTVPPQGHLGTIVGPVRAAVPQVSAIPFGVGILVGLSLFKSTELGDGVTANPGDTWSTAGALPCGWTRSR
jgi:hypothetical protein